MNSQTLLRANFKGLKAQIAALKSLLSEEQLISYDSKMNELKQAFIEQEGITEDEIGEIDKFFL